MQNQLLIISKEGKGNAIDNSKIFPKYAPHKKVLKLLMSRKLDAMQSFWETKGVNKNYFNIVAAGFYNIDLYEELAEALLDETGVVVNFYTFDELVIAHAQSRKSPSKYLRFVRESYNFYKEHQDPMPWLTV